MRPSNWFRNILIAAALGSAAFAQTGWNVMSSRDPGSSNLLYGVAGTSGADVWAVGRYDSNSISEHWNGDALAVVPSPPPLYSRGCNSLQEGAFAAVSAASAQDVWAVGHQCYLPNLPFAAHWNGTSWTKVPIPLPLGSRSGYLSGVAALSSDDVWAVGAFQNRVAENVMYAVHWDGTKWAVVAVPRPPQSQGELYGIAAVSPGDIWAVGYFWSAATNYYTKALIEHWDGSAWSIVQSPSPGRTGNTLYAVTAVSSTDVWAVGSLQDPNGNPALTVHWDGAAWTRVPSPSPQLASSTNLMGVAAVSSTEVWAAGYASSGSAVEPISQHWNGTRWVPAFTPDPGLDAQLFAVSVTGGNVWAVGAYTKTGLHYGSLQSPLTYILKR